MGGFAGGKVLEIHGKRMIEDNYAPGFKTVLHLKDVGIVNDIAGELGLDMPVTHVGYGLLQRAVDAGFGEVDSAALFKVTE
jgi:2-hydroxy-3-oxopropionate reductase